MCKWKTSIACHRSYISGGEKQNNKILPDNSCLEMVLNPCLLKRAIGKGIVAPQGDLLFEE